jgi:hypothetical protein
MARQSELLPVAYVHVVFTLPHQLSPLKRSASLNYRVFTPTTLTPRPRS